MVNVIAQQVPEVLKPISEINFTILWWVRVQNEIAEESPHRLGIVSTFAEVDPPRHDIAEIVSGIVVCQSFGRVVEACF